MKTGTSLPMSEPIYARFPRFDRVPEVTPSQRLRRIVKHQPAAQPVVNPTPPETPDAPLEPVSDAEAAPEAAPPAVGAPQAPGSEEVEAVLDALNRAIEEASRSAKAEAAGAVRAMAETLFPTLSQAFLGEEIVRHLQDWLPVSPERVTVTAPEGLQPILETALARRPDLAGRCELVTGQVASDVQVRVSWRTGGLDFDFDGLLEACLARLETAQPRNGM